MVPFPPAGERPHLQVSPAPGRTLADRPGNRRRWPYLLLLTTVLAAGVLSQTPPGRSMLRVASVAGVAAAYTELAFAAPQDLPSQLAAAEVTTLPTFQIHNVTGEARVYRWSVTLSSTGGAVQSKTGEAPIADGKRAMISPVLKVDCRPGPLTATIRLASSGESIKFTTDCLAADAGDMS
jgi:hypothetical protein